MFVVTASEVKVLPRPSPPKKLKTAKAEIEKDTEETEWIEDVPEYEELKRKVIPPKLQTKIATPAVNVTKTVKKTSVFDRLGESNVTSTTPEIQDPPAIAKVKIQNSQKYLPLIVKPCT